MGAPSRPGRPRSAPCSARRASSRCRSTQSSRCLACPPRARGVPVSVVLHGVAVLFSGDLDRAEAILDQAAEAAVAGGAVWAGVVARSERALLALERGDLAAAESELALAGAFVDDAPSTDYVVTAILLAVTARVAIAKGQGARARTDARERPAHASDDDARPVLVRGAGSARAREGASGPVGRTRRGDALPRGGRHPSSTPERSARSWPKPKRCERSSRRSPTQSSGWASTLTAAELRLLPLLTTHLSFREIAERLFVSRNTVKTQAISVYRKLDASSRSEAIERAIELGLVDAPLAASRGDYSPARGDVFGRRRVSNGRQLRGRVQAHASQARAARRSLHRRAARARSAPMQRSRESTRGRMPSSESQRSSRSTPLRPRT